MLSSHASRFFRSEHHQGRRGYAPVAILFRSVTAASRRNNQTKSVIGPFQGVTEYSSLSCVGQLVAWEVFDGPTVAAQSHNLSGGSAGSARATRARSDGTWLRLRQWYRNARATAAPADSAPEAAPIATCRGVSVKPGRSANRQGVACGACLGTGISAHLWGPCRHCAGEGVEPAP